MTAHQHKPVGRDRRFGRRSFLAAAGTAAVGAALPIRPRLLGIGPATSLAAKPKPFKARLPIPEVRTDAQIALAMEEAEIDILPGRPTRMWTYGGSFPGPTIRRPAGQQTQVTFSHRLSDAGALTVHLHGGHSASQHDGQPGAPPGQPDPDNPGEAFYCEPGQDPETVSPVLIEPGGERTYVYEGMEDGQPERAAFQWYHDHRCHATAHNVWRGLAGMWIIDDELDASLGLPSGRRDIPLMITDRSFNKRNQLKDPFPDAGDPPNDEVTGKLVLVNGAYLPHHEVSGRKARLRVLNASNFRTYNLALSNGARMTQIATEAGLMPQPLRRKQVLLGPGERAELVIDFGEFPNRDVELVSVRRRDGVFDPGSKAFVGPLMQFRVGSRKPDDAEVPEALRPVPAWAEEAEEAWDAAASPDADKDWRFHLGSSSWEINGKQYDPTYVEHEVRIDTTEAWRLANDSGTGHLIHLHHTDWYMLERNGGPPRPPERCLKETFFLDPFEEVVVAGHFSDHLGEFVVHCHMLDHEDHGMMSQFKVVPASP